MTTAETLLTLCLPDEPQRTTLLTQTRDNLSRWDAWLPPLAAGNGAGVDPTYEDDFQLMREEINKLSGTETDTLCRLAEQIVTHQARDIRVVAWYSFARLQRDGDSGLADGLMLLTAMLKQAGQYCHPLRSSARLAALEWLNSDKVLDALSRWPDVTREDTARTAATLCLLEVELASLPDSDRPSLAGLLRALETRLAGTGGLDTPVAAPLQDEMSDAGNATSAGSAVPAATAVKSEVELVRQLRILSGWVVEQPQGWLAAHRIMKAARWDLVTQLPALDASGRTRLLPPKADYRAQLKRLYLQQSWAELVEQVDMMFTEGGNYNRLLDGSITQLNRFLDTPAVRGTLRTLRIYNPYHYLAGKIDELKGMISTSALLEVMDGLMKVTRSLFDTVTRWGPSSLQRPVAALWDTLVLVRNKADSMLAKALKPLSDILERQANRLRVEGDNAFRAHVGDNAHLYGGARASEELAYFRREKPDWVDMRSKKRSYPALEEFKGKEAIADGWPDISERSKNPALRSKFNTFDNSMKAVEIPPGTVIYRVVDPSSSDNNICWMRKAEFDKLTSKSDWRRHFAVWKKWNENGEYVTYITPPGQPLKVWEGRAGTQINLEAPEYSLEGGAVQIVLDPSQLKKEYTGPRQKTGWGYGDGANDPVYPYQGLPKLENTHSWYEPKDKN